MSKECSSFKNSKKIRKPGCRPCFRIYKVGFFPQDFPRRRHIVQDVRQAAEARQRQEEKLRCGENAGGSG